MGFYNIEIDEEFSARVREKITGILILRIRNKEEAKNRYDKLISEVDSKGRVCLTEYTLECLADLEKTYEEEKQKEEIQKTLPPYNEEEVYEGLKSCGRDTDKFEKWLAEYMKTHQKPTDSKGER